MKAVELKIVSVTLNELHIDLNRQRRALNKGLLEHGIICNEIHVHEEKSKIS